MSPSPHRAGTLHFLHDNLVQPRVLIGRVDPVRWIHGCRDLLSTPHELSWGRWKSTFGIDGYRISHLSQHSADPRLLPSFREQALRYH
mmetsp:Transcript_18034/g.27315  ORF Transcript_18034/g.27315 Transcript_18034/m.27315 type:complete len:88 (+) Transcript_18034:92-355(+)